MRRSRQGTALERLQSRARGRPVRPVRVGVRLEAAQHRASTRARGGAHLICHQLLVGDGDLVEEVYTRLRRVHFICRAP